MFAMHSNIKIMETTANKKSVALSEKEKKALRIYRKQFVTDVACAGAIGVDRNVLIRVLMAGSAAPETIKKIKRAISASTINADSGK
jgi:predicted DNA-binding protein (UPF0251 family)